MTIIIIIRPNGWPTLYRSLHIELTMRPHSSINLLHVIILVAIVTYQWTSFPTGNVVVLLMHSAIKRLFKVLAIPNSSTICLRSLQTVLPQSALPINRTMSLSTSSSFHKIHESPFSHKAMYGSDHPYGNDPLKKPKGRDSVVKIKKICGKKLKRRKKSVSGKSISVSNSRNSSVSSIRTSLVSTHSSSISTLPSVISTHSYPSSHQSTLAKIDCDSPNSIRARSKNQSLLHGLKLPHKHSLVTTSSVKSINKTDNLFLKLNPPSSSISSQSAISTPSTISLRLSRTHSSVSVHNGITRNPLGFCRGFTSRQNGDQFTIQDLACGLKRLQYKKIVVMSGAGISTTSGIPDFRYVSHNKMLLIMCTVYYIHVITCTCVLIELYHFTLASGTILNPN